MTAIKNVFLVARRELTERARSGMFIASLVISVLVIGAVVVLPTMMMDETRQIGLVDTASPAVGELVTAEAEKVGLTAEVTEYSNVADAEAALAAGELDAAVVADREVVWPAEPDTQLESALDAALFMVAVQERSAELGLDPAAAAELLAPAEIGERSLEPVDSDVEARQVMAMVTMIVLFTAIAMYGAFVLTGVVEEKSSRVVEVLLARVPPRHLLAGKILGIGTLGLAQIAVMTGAAVLALQVSGDGSIELPSISLGLVALFLLWFILGFAFYSTAYGALGALASRNEDAQSASGPLTALLIGGYFFVLITVAGEGSEGIVRLATLLPFTSPMAVPMRAATGNLPVWEGVAAVVLMLIAIYAMIRIAGRMYTGAVLRTGAKVRIRDAWRASSVGD
ncbi:MAG TPA: ABC transporter permease [Jiangellaceae bacterium]|nr:ABC transporter permease [Jiangellaceae bacterium]